MHFRRFCGSSLCYGIDCRLNQDARTTWDKDSLKCPEMHDRCVAMPIAFITLTDFASMFRAQLENAALGSSMHVLSVHIVVSLLKMIAS